MKIFQKFTVEIPSTLEIPRILSGPTGYNVQVRQAKLEELNNKCGKKR